MVDDKSDISAATGTAFHPIKCWWYTLLVSKIFDCERLGVEKTNKVTSF